jgi:hypothetical protein
MSALDRLIAAPRLVEIDRVDLSAPQARVWELVRHGDLARSPLIRALFAIRTLPSRLAGTVQSSRRICIDDLASSPAQPGFQVLLDDPPHEFAVGAIGKVWEADIPFVPVVDANEFAAFAQPGFVKVAWAIRVTTHGPNEAHLEIEVRVDGDDEAWSKFRRYFRVIGPASRFIRHSLLRALARDLGSPEGSEEDRPLPGDELLPDATGQMTHFVDIAAPPTAIWPWLLQMGCRRAGYYSIDWLDNARQRSATEIRPELQQLHVGDVIPATPEGDDGFEVLRIDEPRSLVLGGLFDADVGRQVPFGSTRPARYSQMTWSFVLQRLDTSSSRLVVRVRAAFHGHDRLRLAWIRPVHHLMQSAQLRNLAARAEGRLPRDGWNDVMQGVGGAAIMTAAFLTPFLRGARSHWGLDGETAAKTCPGDEVIAKPRWTWTHGVEVKAPAREVWPWLAQIGADRGGFYSYQWLENIAGCDLRNADVVHPEWEVRNGDQLILHPKMPPLPVLEVARGHHFLAHAPLDERARAQGKPWVEATWLFLVEPLDARRCRVISRYRMNGSDDVATRVQFGPTFIEPVGFAMDRRMLIGIKERAERAGSVRQGLRNVAST